MSDEPEPSDDDDWSDYDSGPFCRHYSQLGDCDDICGACGHSCNMHDGGNDGNGCDENGCTCPGWKESEEPTR